MRDKPTPKRDAIEREMAKTEERSQRRRSLVPPSSLSAPQIVSSPSPAAVLIPGTPREPIIRAPPRNPSTTVLIRQISADDGLRGERRVQAGVGRGEIRK